MSKLVIRLKGGLGNQMFQFAAAKALALRTRRELVLDKRSGFVRDRVFRRSFSLAMFPIRDRAATAIEQLPFWYEAAMTRFGRRLDAPLRWRPWGVYLVEHSSNKMALSIPSHGWPMFMEGAWQTERYFEDSKPEIAASFALPGVCDPPFARVAHDMERSESVAIGVRLFEELPGVSKRGVGGLTPLDFYERAAVRLAVKLRQPKFFVFCTCSSIVGKLALPGACEYITPARGFTGDAASLWLFSRARNHIIANSSFYWWGAWLAEQNYGQTEVIASSLFAHSEAVPKRWQRVSLPDK